MPRTHRALTRVLLMLLTAVLLATAAGGALAGRKKGAVLDRMMYDYSAAIRWGDFEGAWTLVDPKEKEKHPMTDLDFSRYQQIEVTSYRELATRPGPDGTVLREIQISLVNRHTLSERSMRYTEVWHFDDKLKTWWIMALPDFWASH